MKTHADKDAGLQVEPGGATVASWIASVRATNRGVVAIGPFEISRGIDQASE
ncbi:MAG: hypothetical protein CAPSK01_003442 [Candidatus Accumulibacter vicinus]|uniref:Uncharacterized protein n=1 Tax=Candidatus Accumulibacter vicinus TaxID=2954382 RepID=A0A084XXY0_9PROT|nr:MAG: hypothetical protein CAPSK01_003442 [Candidatus Accumulibacter vicinus]